ncbi:flavoprotein [Rhizobium aethiopicum]|uniref:Flavoprotein n=1 Tax=Rhizobium aethiopicum TaxID=1138170 RepID=A0A7W6VT85_9HYPH|nr:hypothetical protein [Rhizobium aethiopicum]MBB4196215.1 flavoprotein [Rhizobium aethiopicum]MBB4583988.1 flavoprotein [Rhizobium aethiopicum]
MRRLRRSKGTKPEYYFHFDIETKQIKALVPDTTETSCRSAGITTPVSPLNSRKSASMPSLKMTPCSGISENDGERLILGDDAGGKAVTNMADI